MSKREIISLPAAQVEIEPRDGYLFVVESGQLRNMAELRRYTDAMDDAVRRTGLTTAVIDARGEIGDPPQSVRDAMWAWLMDPGRGFSVIAFVLPSEMAVARVNMTALSQQVSVRAFDSVFAAQRWLRRGPRFSTQAATRRPSSRPPAPEAARRSDIRATRPTEVDRAAAPKDEPDGSRVA